MARSLHKLVRENASFSRRYFAFTEKYNIVKPSRPQPFPDLPLEELYPAEFEGFEGDIGVSESSLKFFSLLFAHEVLVGEIRNLIGKSVKESKQTDVFRKPRIVEAQVEGEIAKLERELT